MAESRKELIKRLENIAKEMRKQILIMTTKAGSGHPTSAMSAIDIIVALYFGGIMKFDSKKPNWEERDRFLMSKGHACPAQYAVLAELGYFPKEELGKLRRINGILQGHPDRIKTPGIEISSGSLGMGLSVGNGVALAAKLDKKDYRAYVMLSDGDMQEGQTWEAIESGAHFKLDNVVAIVDKNRLQNDCWVEEEKNIYPLEEKFKAFGWATITIDGHNFGQILTAFEKALHSKGKPTAIIANTVKGKGVSFMENKLDFHGKALSEEELEKALAELEKVKA